MRCARQTDSQICRTQCRDFSKHKKSKKKGWLETRRCEQVPLFFLLFERYQRRNHGTKNWEIDEMFFQFSYRSEPPMCRSVSSRASRSMSRTTQRFRGGVDDCASISNLSGSRCVEMAPTIPKSPRAETKSLRLSLAVETSARTRREIVQFASFQKVKIKRMPNLPKEELVNFVLVLVFPYPTPPPCTCIPWSQLFEDQFAEDLKILNSIPNTSGVEFASLVSWTKWCGGRRSISLLPKQAW